MLEKKGQEQVVSYVILKRVLSWGKFDFSSCGYKKFVGSARLESLSQNGDSCLTIVCTITVTPESKKPPLELPGDLERMLRDERGMDVMFKVGGQEYRAHRFIMAAQSPVFKAMLFGPMVEKDMRCLDVIDMVTWSLLSSRRCFTLSIYSDSLPKCSVDKGPYSAAMMQHLLVAADRYGLERLKLRCEEKLCKKFDARTITTTLKLADQHHCKRLKDACLEFLSHGRHRLCPRV
jgi:speckle-type POZ protein